VIDPDATQLNARELQDDECADFQAQMAERIGAGEDLQSYAHMQTCERCQAFVRELEEIARAAREFMGFELEPARDLWLDIDKAIKKGDPEAESGSGREDGFENGHEPNPVPVN